MIPSELQRHNSGSIRGPKQGNPFLVHQINNLVVIPEEDQGGGGGQ